MNPFLGRRTFTLSLVSAIGAVGAACAGLAPGSARASGTTLQVGPHRALKSLAAAARSVQAGTVVEVDAGEYLADVATWVQPQVTIRAVGGRVRLVAAGAAAEQKAIWVVRASDLHVEGFDFEGASVPSRNGAGIRLERGSLHVQDCRFLHNEMGLLTNNDPSTVLRVTDCEFAHNQRPDGHNHNLYVGQIAELSVTGSYFHHARNGHLLKSRAAINHVLYNRLTDEPGGTASYELEFPNGGLAVVLGNIIEQGSATQNPHLVRFGAEQLKWARNELYLVNNTLVDALPNGGIYLATAPGTQDVLVANNLLLGNGRWETGAVGRFVNNFQVNRDEFEQDTPDDYRLKASSRLVGKAIEPSVVPGLSLRVQAEFQQPRGSRPVPPIPHNPGAVQRVAQARKP